MARISRFVVSLCTVITGYCVHSRLRCGLIEWLFPKNVRQRKTCSGVRMLLSLVSQSVMSAHFGVRILKIALAVLH